MQKKRKKISRDYKQAALILLEQLIKAYKNNYLTLLSGILNSEASNKLKNVLIDLLYKYYINK